MPVTGIVVLFAVMASWPELVNAACQWSSIPLPGCLISTAYSGPYTSLSAAQSACEASSSCAHGQSTGGVTSSIIPHNGTWNRAYFVTLGANPFFQAGQTHCGLGVEALPAESYFCGGNAYNLPCAEGSCVESFRCASNDFDRECSAVCSECVPSATANTPVISATAWTGVCACLLPASGSMMAPPRSNSSCFTFSVGSSENGTKVRRYPPEMGRIVCPALVNRTNLLNPSGSSAGNTSYSVNVASTPINHEVTVTRTDSTSGWDANVQFTCCTTATAGAALASTSDAVVVRPTAESVPGTHIHMQVPGAFTPGTPQAPPGTPMPGTLGLRPIVPTTSHASTPRPGSGVSTVSADMDAEIGIITCALFICVVCVVHDVRWARKKKLCVRLDHSPHVGSSHVNAVFDVSGDESQFLHPDVGLIVY